MSKLDECGLIFDEDKPELELGATEVIIDTELTVNRLRKVFDNMNKMIPPHEQQLFEQLSNNDLEMLKSLTNAVIEGLTV